MKLLFFTTSVLLATVITSCNNTSNQQSTQASVHAIEQLVNDTSASTQTFFLRFVDQTETDSSVIYVGKSLFNSDTVGLKLEVMNDIAPGIDAQGQPDEKNGFREGALKISSIGKQSDALVASMAHLFGLPTSGKMTSNVISPLVFSSNHDIVDLNKNGTYSFKLFFPNSVGDEAEVFAVVDLYKKSFKIEEKNASFRKQLLSAFEGN